ncbi:M23 family metallopeptidase [Streptomyces sp. SCSIO ZS0520]|uniref:M23 family metallopeptidase n=1 Tax=Streptomyces sp. SCSIO ZS0520 TaxID=2892996 RepID=UPI0021DAC734|nr:M23 family metallopeptidase [Streptomyces sp. SCSIO ZS0520]
MASNGPATRVTYVPGDEESSFGQPFGEPLEEPLGEWNPTAESVRPVRGRHRVIKQRGGLARSSTVLGVGVIAAVGAGGMATAQGGKPPVRISVPDVSAVTASLPEAKSLPGVGDLVAGSGEDSAAEAAAPLSAAGQSASEDAGESLRSRILQQAEQQQAAADTAAQRTAEEAATERAAEEAAELREKAEKKAAAAKKKAQEEARRKAEEERLAKLAKMFSLPTSSYTLTSHFGDAGSMWSSGHHTGLDFAAPTGTPLKAVHTGTVKSAGWSGAYGYRTVLELEDGTEVWYCHQSSMSVSAGQKVSTGEVIGRVGATGNVTGPHLHMEVHTPDGTGIDPLSWLQSKGINP